MEEKEAKIRFDSGELKLAVVIPALMAPDHWNLLVDRAVSAGGDGPYRISKQRGGDRAFKTIDAACATAKKIGFPGVVVNFDCHRR